MGKIKPVKPEFYRTFITEGFFPNSNKITRFEESDNYWIFKTGTKIYKVKKNDTVQSAVSLEELFCNEIVNQIQQHSPGLNAQIFTVKKENESFTLDWNNKTPPKALYYGISMNQLTDRGFISNIIDKNMLSEQILEQIANHLITYYQTSKISQSKEDGSPDAIKSKLENLIYQSKKFLGVTITKAILDITFRPLAKYLTDNRKAFNRRIKREHIRMVQGCFIPRKIHVTKDAVNFLGKTSDPLKNRYNDVAADLADLTVELQFAGMEDKAVLFIDKFSRISGDKEIKLVLPVYQALRCLHQGLKNSILANHSPDKEKEVLKRLAIQYYEQTIDVVRGL